MKITTISLFPEIFTCLDMGITGRAQAHKLVDLTHSQLRDYSTQADGRIDDKPYGGTGGMVMSPEPIYRALKDHVRAPTDLVIHLSPCGQTFNQTIAKQLSTHSHLLFLCSRYEGIDQRLTPHIDLTLSLGDFVISGGEIAAACMIDAVIREIPGALGNAQSLKEDSHQHGLLDYPHFTRPWQWHGQSPQDVLRSGNHSLIDDWKRQQSIGRTWLLRPDLLLKKNLSDIDIKDLTAFLKQHNWE